MSRIPLYWHAAGFSCSCETEASTLAQSSGFLIDGRAGVSTPIPERLDKVLKAFEWLSHRSRVDDRWRG